ncbi:MAG: PIN domain-containing protein, partial [Salinisphaera sp.]|nr:PIN domain-containing protein [Salinisphaera sp.]
MTTPAPRRRVFILDTNVLMHDPAALLRFHEHDVFLPMVVLEELDAAKKGLSEVARNVRQVSRLLDELMTGHGHADIEAGLPLTRLSAPNGKESDATARGRLFFEIHPPSAGLPATLAASKADNSILASA